MKDELLEGINVGDRIKIIDEDREYIGILMPHHRFSGEEIVTLKLENGYNIGIKLDKNSKIKLLEKESKVKETKKEIVDIDESLPTVSILGTGGTIASYVEYRTGAVHPAQSAEDMLYSNPEIAKRCNPFVDIIFSKLSEDIEPEDWVEIADRVIVELNSGSEGVVIAHGTDTMGYTAAALSFLIDGLNKPVVFVGSQRSSDRPSSDAHLNLLAAVEVAKSDLSGVFVVMHENMSDDKCSIHKGTKVRKMHTSRRDAFKSINTEPIGFVYPKKEKIEIKDEVDNKNENVCRRGSIEPNVSLIYAYPGLSENELLEAGKGEGIVIAGTGLGHLNSKFIPVLKDIIDNDTPVLMTSQCLNGTVNDHVYSSGRRLLEIGVIPAGDMLPETALVKLMWSLTLEEDLVEVMNKNIAGELTERRIK